MRVAFGNLIDLLSKAIRRMGLFLFVLVVLTDCNNADKAVNQSKESNVVSVFETELYELHLSENQKAILILYPGAGTTSADTKAEFDILEKAKKNNLSVLLMNFTNHLWITEDDCQNLTEALEGAFAKHEIDRENIYIGGMSVGGTVALSLSNYLLSNSSDLAPEGVFIVDSPIDLSALYESARGDLLREDFSEERLSEPRFIVQTFQEEFGSGDSLPIRIAEFSPFIHNKGINNASSLSNTKLRFYTEPDSLWWRENRDTDYENTNSHVIQQISLQLDSAGWEQYRLIETEGKGYRANGDRHPHSWSIVDVDDLIEWITE
ncbi:MAG: hypothetical protein WBG42_04970 [Cryomorphaceae bacterium]